jgi:tRNA A37 threonylcarbamoyladenosine dehydratase
MIWSGNWYERTELLIGSDGIDKLQKSNVLIAGLGGVGGIAAEMLCRAGIGKMTIADSDIFSPSNLNRQIGALSSNQGLYKAEVIKNRLHDINPELNLTIVKDYLKDNTILNLIHASNYDYVIDAIDTLSPKVFFIYHCLKTELKLVSSMGAGGKLDPTLIKISDISESSECRFAYAIRKKLHKLGIETGFDVVYSTEKVPRNVIVREEKVLNKKSTVGTISYIPATFGTYCSSVVIRNLLNKK